MRGKSGLTSGVTVTKQYSSMTDKVRIINGNMAVLLCSEVIYRDAYIILRIISMYRECNRVIRY